MILFIGHITAAHRLRVKSELINIVGFSFDFVPFNIINISLIFSNTYVQSAAEIQKCHKMLTIIGKRKDWSKCFSEEVRM